MNGPLKGALFWEWVAQGAKPSERGVQTTDSTWQYDSFRTYSIHSESTHIQAYAEVASIFAAV